MSHIKLRLIREFNTPYLVLLKILQDSVKKHTKVAIFRHLSLSPIIIVK